MGWEDEFESASRNLEISRKIIDNECGSEPPNYDNYTKEDWEYVQRRYEEYCDTFSPCYISGCVWYQILGNDIKKGYMQWKLNQHDYEDLGSLVFMFGFG
jgi:hypothetical protein